MKKMMAVLYSYCELGKKQDLRIKNLEFFIRHGLILDGNTDYYFCINGHKLSTKIPDHRNIKIVYRDNKNFDFGSYSELLLSDKFNTDDYKYFFFINDSVRGPFMFDWSKKMDWRNIFIDLLDDETKMAGPTINNYNGKAHVNSECFIVDTIGLKIGLDECIFSNKSYSKIKEVCDDCEVKYSQKILDNGYNIKCLMLAYKNIDFRNHRNDKSLNANYEYKGDPLFNNAYYGINLNPYEVIFLKINRNINELMVSNYTNWHNK